MTIEYAPGATPLDPDDVAGLIPGLSTQADLNEFEAKNILQAVTWVTGRLGRRKSFVIDETEIRSLHRRMFGDTWRWAGRYRTRLTNIGIDPRDIPVQVRSLCDDVRHWVDHDTYPWPELPVRFHHQLVFIHPFPNGNGRHARLAADILAMSNGHAALSWGGGESLANAGALRSEYLEALREADRGDFRRLIRFARS